MVFEGRKVQCLPVQGCLDDATFLEDQVPRTGRVSSSLCVSQRDDLGVNASARDIQDPDRAQAWGEVVWQHRAPRVDEEYAVAVLEPLNVCVAANEDVDLLAMQRRLQDLRDGPRLRPKFMRHANAPTLHVQQLDFLHSRVMEEVIVALGHEHVRELLAPVQNDGRDNVAAVEDQVEAPERFANDRPELVKAPHEGGQMCVTDKSDPHRANATTAAFLGHGTVRQRVLALEAVHLPNGRHIAGSSGAGDRVLRR